MRPLRTWRNSLNNNVFDLNRIKIHALWTLIGALSAFVLTVIFNVTGLTQLESFQSNESQLYYISDSLAVLIIVYCFATPLVEELIFRYFIFGFLNRHIKRAAVSILITAALFGIYHLHPVQALYGFLMGLLITYSYYRHRYLSVPFMVHLAANAVALAYTIFNPVL